MVRVWLKGGTAPEAPKLGGLGHTSPEMFSFD